MIELINGEKIYAGDFDTITDLTGSSGTGLSDDPETLEIDLLGWFANNSVGVLKRAGNSVVVFKDKIVKITF